MLGLRISALIKIKNSPEWCPFPMLLDSVWGDPALPNERQVVLEDVSTVCSCFPSLFGDTNLSELPRPMVVYSCRYPHRLQSSVSWYMPFCQNRVKEVFFLKLLLVIELFSFTSWGHQIDGAHFVLLTPLTVSVILLNAELKFCLIWRSTWTLECQHLDNSQSFINLAMSNKHKNN